MRKTKRIIALVVVAMFLLSLAAPAAMAATKEDAFGRLNALNVAIGDATGNPQYDKNFTRAEAAAIMVNLSGMNAAIGAAKGATKFKDVAGSHWGSGVINLAVGAGIIKGYPDGTYKPDANVTYAEMSAMLVGVLGYTPKLQGTWPSNVIGKAAQLGLLDGVAVTDYNAAAVRSNVFLASDNALDTKALVEKKDGYEVDTKTLMEDKLSVSVKADATVTNVPLVSGVKGKVTITYADATTETLSVADGIDANAVLGQKAAAWVKDGKVFFFNVKTAASDIITGDTLDGALTDVDVSGTVTAGDTIKLKTAAKTYTLDAAPVTYKNNAASAVPASYASGNAVKLILNNGKVKYLIATSYTTEMVDKVDTAAEKLTMEIGASLTIKDLVNVIVKDGKAITLSDIKAGNVIDYISVANTSNYIVVSDGVVEGKLSTVSSDAKSITIADKATKATGTVYVSTDNGVSYNVTALNSGDDFTAYFGSTVKGFLNKDGKIAYVITTANDATTAISVLVKNVKRIANGAAGNSTYIYVAKFDGTETYYEVNADSKINGIKVKKDADVAGNGYDTTGPVVAGVETGLNATLTNATDTIARGDVVKISLTSDNKIDGITTYANTEIVNALGGVSGAGFSINKTADTIIDTTTAVAYKVDSNTKLLQVAEYTDQTGATAGLTDLTDAGVVGINTISDANALTWAALRNVGTQAAGNIGMIIKDGVAKYVVLYSTNADLTAAPSTNSKYGMFTSSAYDTAGWKWTMTVDGAAMTKTWDNGIDGDGPDKGTMVNFKLTAADKIDSAAAATIYSVSAGAYDYFKVVAVDKTNKRLQIIAVADKNGTAGVGVANFYVDVNDKTKYFNAKDTAAIAAIDLDTLAVNDVVQIYDVVDTNGNDGTDSVFDFVVKRGNL